MWGAGHGLTLAFGIGGVDHIQTQQVAADGTPGQMAGQFAFPDAVGRAVQPIPAVGGGGNDVTLLTQRFDGLPDGGAADPQLLAHGFPGEVIFLMGKQQGENGFTAHGGSSG